MNRQVSARGGWRRPKLEREPNGMAVVAQITKSVNTNRQEVRHARWNSSFSPPNRNSTQAASVERAVEIRWPNEMSPITPSERSGSRILVSQRASDFLWSPRLTMTLYGSS